MATATTKAKALDRIKMRIRKGDTVQVISGTVSYTHLRAHET